MNKKEKQRKQHKKKENKEKLKTKYKKKQLNKIVELYKKAYHGLTGDTLTTSETGVVFFMIKQYGEMQPEEVFTFIQKYREDKNNENNI